MTVEEFRQHVAAVDVSKLPAPAPQAVSPPQGGAAASSSRAGAAPAPKNRDPCAELLRECPHGGCPFKGKLAEMKNHVDNDCEKGYRELDREALRICGGPGRVAKGVGVIKRLLGLGGSADFGVLGDDAAVPLPPSRLQEQLEAEEIHILAKDFFALCGTDTGGGKGVFGKGRSSVYTFIMEGEGAIGIWSVNEFSPVNRRSSLDALFSFSSSFPVVSVLCSSLSSTLCSSLLERGSFSLSSR